MRALAIFASFVAVAGVSSALHCRRWIRARVLCICCIAEGRYQWPAFPRPDHASSTRAVVGIHGCNGPLRRRLRSLALHILGRRNSRFQGSPVLLVDSLGSTEVSRVSAEHAAKTSITGDQMVGDVYGCSFLPGASRRIGKVRCRFLGGRWAGDITLRAISQSPMLRDFAESHGAI